jgi:hypothetical protein
MFLISYSYNVGNKNLLWIHEKVKNRSRKRCGKDADSRKAKGKGCIF